MGRVETSFVVAFDTAGGEGDSCGLGANRATAGAPGRPPLPVVGLYRTDEAAVGVDLLYVMHPDNARRLAGQLIAAARAVEAARASGGDA